MAVGNNQDVVIAAAQSLSVPGDIAANIERHLTFMKMAAEQGADFLLFPELSLTGYEPTLAHELAIAVDDPILTPLRDLARELNMVTVVGAPLRSSDSDGVLIAAIVFEGPLEPRAYTKEHLHGGEEKVFSPGLGGAFVNIASEHIGLAVCADFNHVEHGRKAAQAGATLYAASVLISGPGYENDASMLREHARSNGMTVLIANHSGVTGGWQSGGRSALWSSLGERVAELPGADEGLLLARRTQGDWTAWSVQIPASLWA